MRHFPDPRAEPADRLVSRPEIIRSGLCIGCGSCAAAMRWDRDGFLKPDGAEPPPEQFADQCPFSPASADEDQIAAERFPAASAHDGQIGRFEAAYVGHALEDPFRRNGSSGGLTSWVAAELLRTGAADGVAHVAPADPQLDGRFFAYRISRSLDELSRGAKSRYYPVELTSVLREIREVPGRYAVVGVPCFIKAIHLLRRIDPLIGERVTHTLGLFCGHMKSAAMVESFAWQLGAEIGRVRALDYRLKDESRPANWYRAHLELDDVVGETADVSFGDAWVEPYSSDGRGTNVMVVRSKSLVEMVERARSEGRLELTPVDADFIANTQAAGLRHRRDGLAYRLTWRRRGIVPRKRVRPSAALPLRRKLVYRMRHAIARWSHRIFRFARALRAPAIYTIGARSALRLYQSVTWSSGRLGKLLDRLMPQPER